MKTISLSPVIWREDLFSSLSPEQKLFMLYILINDEAKRNNIYRISAVKASKELGFSVPAICSITRGLPGASNDVWFDEAKNEIVVDLRPKK
jgi:hypothetical protein